MNLGLDVNLGRQSAIWGLNSILVLFHFPMYLINGLCIILLVREKAPDMFYSGMCVILGLISLYFLLSYLSFNVTYDYEIYPHNQEFKSCKIFCKVDYTPLALFIH